MYIKLLRTFIVDKASKHVKISHLVASLPTSRQQVVFALVVPSCQQVWEQSVTSLMALSDLLKGCSNKSDTIMI
jgi:hypothetical protein